MKKRIVCFFAAVAMVMVSAGVSLAENSILSSLKAQGVSHAVMDDAALDAARGTALTVLVGQSQPSYIGGIKTHHVTWKGFGSVYDYNQYNYIGNAWTPGVYNMDYAGGSILPAGTYRVGGDQWWADTQSSPYSWSKANSDLFEIHYQVLYPSDGSPSQYAFHESVWNRPLTTFIW